MATVNLRGLTKQFGDVEVVQGVDLDIAHGEFLVLVGPSGSGKSTVLRMIAGLEEISGGEIIIDGVVVNERAPRDRDIAMVFQDYALYPHLSVFENMAFSLRMRKVPKREIRARVEEAARVLNIDALLDRHPKQLSGGQRQRVAMGRAIVRDPKVFLFDEPLSNLDAKLRVQMRTEIKKIHQRVLTTVIYVTHDQVEAMTMADRIVIMRDGRIEQIGTPDQVYRDPATRFVAGFVGSPSMNFLPCQVEEEDGRLLLRLADGIRLPVPDDATIRLRESCGRDLIFGLRPEHFAPVAGNTSQAALTPCIDVVEPLGADTLAFFHLGGHEVIVRLPEEVCVRAGDSLPLAANMARMRLFDPETGRAL